MISIVYSAALIGVEARLVEVQVDISRGLPCLDTVGLPGASIRESRQRVRSALRSSGLDFPLARVTVNLAPAGVRKEGSSFDLPIALGIAMASSQLRCFADDMMIAVGELGLDGSIRSVNGSLSIAELARSIDQCVLVIPQDNLDEVNIVPGLKVIAANHLTELIERLHRSDYVVTSGRARQPLPTRETQGSRDGGSTHMHWQDLKYVVGLESARRALETAASGGHNLLMIGPPGSGKSMLASCVPGILPPLTLREAIETTKIHSIAGILERSRPLLEHRPFRAPHHSTTLAGLIGGGRPLRPGELSLAHNGVLYLDELGEFNKKVTDALREPLDSGRVVLNRHLQTVVYPCRVFLIASMNPCACGFFGSADRECRCTEREIRSYRSVLSGPFLDRMDMTINVLPEPSERLARVAVEGAAEDSATVRSRVCRARDIQLERFKKSGSTTVVNSQMNPAEIHRYCIMTPEAERLLIEGGRRLQLTGRGMTRCLKVARTIADMDGKSKIEVRHIAEALQFRQI
ncbi:MAG: YifB family Mg chelatase-like AAA ATPase [Bacillota bacterium]|nr:YifB family Mg chelatase-like AAA ATPase [Bacillota bacterium]HOB91797.1 YifB family Mg chelatase-like AAA ATPase [Bacillota bacterium]HQD18114.1 YifB family Mg chelatase-like AAA ATPase [Bacillota bacterium]